MTDFAALFDWDGVIIDSSEFHERSWELLAAERKLVLPPGLFKKGFGMTNGEIIPHLYQWATDPAQVEELSLRKEELYRELIRKNGIKALPGVEQFLSALRKRRIPCVVGSSTPRLNIDTVIGRLGLTGYFKGIITAEDVKKSKPDPEVFLRAARRAGYAPDRCVVFEDSLMGIAAGKAGGMKVVAVTTTNPAEKLAQADMVVDRLDILTIDDLYALF
jgi:beta-phosphoglucomutase family hydrolase